MVHSSATEEISITPFEGALLGMCASNIDTQPLQNLWKLSFQLESQVINAATRMTPEKLLDAVKKIKMITKLSIII